MGHWWMSMSTVCSRAPRVLEFAHEDDVKNVFLERAVRCTLVRLVREGWCTQEFAGLL
jgi:hypothetical protein